MLVKLVRASAAGGVFLPPAFPTVGCAAGGSRQRAQPSPEKAFHVAGCWTGRPRWGPPEAAAEDVWESRRVHRR